MMHSSEASILNASLTNEDHAKAFMLLVREEEAIHLHLLTEAAKVAVVRLGRLQLIRIVKGTVHGAPHAWVSLSRSGQEMLDMYSSEWTDELQRWEELEGEKATVTLEQDQEQEDKQLKHFRAIIAKED